MWRVFSFDLHLERSLIDSVADQRELGGSRELSLGDAMQLHDPLIAAMLGALHRAAGDPADSRLYVDADARKPLPLD